jgi:hypothetical protein
MYKNVPPPSPIGKVVKPVAKSHTSGIAKSYFDEDSDEESDRLDKRNNDNKLSNILNDNVSDFDPLDAYM